MTYQETIDYLYSALPMFEVEGGSAYKPGLERVKEILRFCGNPESKLKCIHVAGTNGKGSTSSMIASILNEAGYRVGLFTSPHLVDFRERIRIGGEMISREYVVEFVERLRALLPRDLMPTFFEYTTAMAFKYYADKGVDFAVIEVGMGGRLDSTNVITPLVSVITNVSLDHTQYLGDTLGAIATEKAGIIKYHVPVVLGRSSDEEVTKVIQKRSGELEAPLIMADKSDELVRVQRDEGKGWRMESQSYGSIYQPLSGEFQVENTRTVLEVCKILVTKGLHINETNVRDGLLHVTNMGLHGRLERVRESDPAIFLETGHNPGAWVYLSQELERMSHDGLTVVLGMSGDKDASSVLNMLPHKASYLIAQASGHRAMDAEALAHMAEERGLNAKAVGSVRKTLSEALRQVRDQRVPNLFVGGSNYVIGDLLNSVSLSELSEWSLDELIKHLTKE